MYASNELRYVVQEVFYIPSSSGLHFHILGFDTQDLAIFHLMHLDEKIVLVLDTGKGPGLWSVVGCLGGVRNHILCDNLCCHG